MAEYIEREAVEEFIQDGLNNPDKDKAFGHDAIEILAGIHFMLAADVAPVRHGRWKYYHKQNKAVCTCCSFERDLDADFGMAVACPNCGALMDVEGGRA